MKRKKKKIKWSKIRFIQVSYFVSQIFFIDFNVFLLDTKPISLESHLLLSQLFKDKQQQFIVIFAES